MHIGVLTGGGDAPGLNAVIRGITVRGSKNGHRITGFLRGWKGAIENESIDLDLDRVRDIHMEGGTILLSSRTNPFKVENGFQGIKETYSRVGLDCLIAMGGEDTLGVADRLHSEGIKVIGVPKTIDNDLSATDFTFGFDTAINYVMKALDMTQYHVPRLEIRPVRYLVLQHLADTDARPQLHVAESVLLR
jgi:6-phosphofructokinase 1